MCRTYTFGLLSEPRLDSERYVAFRRHMMRVTHRVLAIAGLYLCQQVTGQVPAPGSTTTKVPVPAAPGSEAKSTGKKPTAGNTGLSRLLKQGGFEILKLERKNLTDQKIRKRQLKHLIVEVELNQISASLMVDTGTPTTNIARDKLQKFSLTEQESSSRVTSPLGAAPDKFYGIAKLNTLAMGNCVMQDVPVLIDAIPFIDGVLGSDDMRRVGAVLDCGEPALYCAPHGPGADTSNKLAATMEAAGFTKVPMRLRSDHRLEVSCSIDGIPSTIIVDTGSLITCADNSIAATAGITTKRTKTVVLGSGGASAQVRIGRVKQLAIGDFKIRGVDIVFVDLPKNDSPSACILGIGELVSNNAILDLGALSLYLQHPHN